MAEQQPKVGARTTADTAAVRNSLASKLRSPSNAQKPPNLRPATSTAISCAHCRYWKRGGVNYGACRKYGGYRTRDTQVCDSFMH